MINFATVKYNINKIGYLGLFVLGFSVLPQDAWTQCCTLEISKTIATANDDAEESASGNMSLNSSDIELVNDGGNGNQIVGLRFRGMDLQPGMIIEEAYLHFTSDEETSNSFSSLIIRAESSDNSAPFINIDQNLSNRNVTSNSVSWIADSWTVPFEKSEKHKTPDLKSVIQEVITRPGWEVGNALTFIITGIGNRSSIAFDDDPIRAAQLVIKTSQPVQESKLENIFINELMSSNSIIKDEFGDTDDWFEIYNNNAAPLFLGGLFVTDDREDLKKWRITSAPLIEPNGFGLIWADKDLEQGGLHADFKLKSSGEFLAIVQELNGEIFVLDSLTFPEISQNISYGRLEDGADEWVLFGETSPKGSNNGNGQAFDQDVLFSEQSGHFPNSIMLEMSVTDPLASIHYTVDGSVPQQSDLRYEGPILIEETTSIKAKAFKPGFSTLKLTSEFFIINEPSELAILNVESAPENFWDDEVGIYVPGTNGVRLWCNGASNNWNQEWERPCKLTLYETNGNKGFEVNAGMKIGGACSRNLKQKSLNFFLRNSAYGDEKIEYPIFPNQDITEFRRFKIRNGGTDWIEMLFRDAMNHVLLEDKMDLDIMGYRPVRVYLNGAFWGIHGAREMFNKYYIASHHGVDPENIDLLGDPYGNGSIAREGDFERYNEMINFVTNNQLSINSNYEAMNDFIDLQQYINYHIVQVYIANYDWPANNVRIWRDREGGKFRWLFFDSDASTGFQEWGEDVAFSEHNTLEHAMNTQNIGSWPNSPRSTYLFRQMMSNENFKNEYIQRMCSFRALIFDADRVTSLVDSVENLLLPEMGRHISHWNSVTGLGEGVPSGGSVEEWRNNVENYRKFYTERETYIPTMLRQNLSLDQTYDLTFGYDEDTNGSIVLHQNSMELPFNYSGEYFANVPIKIKAIAKEGYLFSHWLETGDVNAEIDFSLSNNQTLTPIFKDDAVSTNPLELELKVSIFPNPTEDMINVTFENFIEESTLELIDVYGKILDRIALTSPRTSIKIEGYTTGLYFTKIKTPKGNIVKQIFIN